ncbi:MAG: chromosomal replication initiator protein DnaA [Campylobacteraceae bacterium]|nr:chromosomal replication initiator protein DnaA [Campylobacteraceae bacterium]MBT3882696.1 chromosomal replication initiator protein DnaA [Campylobacteraceae bacterium]MBT4030422.1 chromosomal replication initiator protein DnaA [Campylobacteraceae bacterium]MBT4178987.1 chromosomal replication initiator protein DnaA [Campylobacteraceae bacterium]MBT4573014.1 chromosomal replication initiator protein DnaA [Campylobacteraceae bacterium]
MTTQKFLNQIKLESTEQDYTRYLSQLVFKKNSSNEQLSVFEVPNKYIAKYINTRFIDTIKKTILKIINISTEVEIRIIGERKQSKTQIKKNQEDEVQKTNSILNASYTFDSFIVGSSNQMAYNAALAVAKKGAMQFNPFFIYGGTGLGKTHLIQAIGNYCIDDGKKVIYVTSEQFMNDFTFSIKNNTMHHFRDKYRSCDVLLIDDVQFFSNKEQTQEEFFHTFNELHSANKQIIMTSDRLPSQIPSLVDRLKTRFEWGLIADVQIPGLETKIAIVKKKSELNGFILDNDVINFIATSLDSSIREIEGVIIKINASSSLLGQSINLEFVKNLLKDHIKDKKENIKLPDIINVVASELNIKPSDLKSTKRTANVVNARRVTIYLARELTLNSMQDIAKYLGMKDYSSVSKNITKANELIEKDDNFKLIIDNIKSKIINKE